jgi:hypothetical protein
MPNETIIFCFITFPPVIQVIPRRSLNNRFGEKLGITQVNHE